MGLTKTIARRSLIGRPGRTLFSIGGIAVGIATVVGIFALDHNTVLSRGARPDAEWQAEIEVSPSVAVIDPGAELEELEGISNVTAAFQNAAGLWRPAVDQKTPFSVHVVAIEAEDAPALGAYTLRAGRDIAPRAEHAEALIGLALAEELELGVGDRIELSRPRRAPRRKCVDGVWEVEEVRQSDPRRVGFEVVGVLERQDLGRRARGHVVILDYEPGLTVYDGADVQTRYWAKRDPNVDIERTEKRLSEAHSYELQKSVIVGQAADERAFRNGVRFAGLMALVLGLFVIFYTLSRSLLERVREVGTLHALGASRGQVARVFVAEAAFIAVGGGVVGLGGGLLLAHLLLRAGITTLGRGAPIRTFDVPWATVSSLVLVGVAIALIGSVYPLMRAKRLSVVAALRGDDQHAVRGLQRGFQIFAAVLLVGVLPGMYFAVVPVIGEVQEELVGVLLVGLGVLAVFIALPLVAPSILAFVAARLTRPFEGRWPLAGRLAARSIALGSGRVAGAVAGIALVTAGYVGLRGMTASLQGEIHEWSDAAIIDKVFVRHLPNVPFDALAEELHRWPGVLGVEPADLRHYVPFLVTGLRASELAGYGPCADDPELLERFVDDHGVILSRRLSDHIEKDVGDEVHVRTGDGDVESLPVIAVSDAYGYFPHPDERLYGCLADATMRELFCIDTVTCDNVAVTLEPGTDPGLVRTAVMGFLAHGTDGEFEPGPYDGEEPGPPAAVAALREGVAFEPGRRVFWWHVSDIRHDFVLFDIIVLLTAVLAALGMLNGQLLAALERTKELGVLAALGTDRRQVAGMVLLEAAVVGVLGGALGVALGLGLGPVIVETLTAISGLPLPHVAPGLAAVSGVLGALGLAIAAALYPIWRMNRTDAVAAVRAPG